jgi:HlyD family secretion protein
MKRRVPVIVLVVVLVAAGLGYWWWSSRTPAVAPPLATGTVEADQYQVASLVSARVAQVMVKEGDTVKAGQTVVTLDSTALDLLVQQASEGVNAANATLQQAQKDGPDTAIAEAQARVNQAQASLALAKVQQGYATITAPHDGVVSSLVTNVGLAAAPGRVLMTLTDTTNVYARVYVAEPDLAKISMGGTVRVTSDGVAPVTAPSRTSPRPPSSPRTTSRRRTSAPSSSTRCGYGSRTRRARTSPGCRST